MFFIVPDFAVNDLKLSGNNLLIFSLIYSFKKPVSLSFNTIAMRVNCSRRSAINSIQYLINMRYICSNKQPFANNQQIAPTYYISSEIFSLSLAKVSENNSNNGEIFSPNNNNNNISNIFNSIKEFPLAFDYTINKMKFECSISAFECWIKPVEYYSYYNNLLYVNASTDKIKIMWNKKYKDLFISLCPVPVDDIFFFKK